MTLGPSHCQQNNFRKCLVFILADFLTFFLSLSPVSVGLFLDEEAQICDGVFFYIRDILETVSWLYKSTMLLVVVEMPWLEAAVNTARGHPKHALNIHYHA